MAIKGKGRTKPKQLARAPRREPVVVKPPFFARRWVQVTLAFVAGFLAMMFVVWVTNGLRERSRADDRAATLGRTKGIVQAWAAAAQADVGTVATVQPPAPPQLLPEAGAAIAAIATGDDATGSDQVLRSADDGLAGAVKSLTAYDLRAEIIDQGFNVTQTNYLLNSRSRMIAGLKLYREAVSVARQAADASGSDRRELGHAANDLVSQATEIFQDGWSDLEQAKLSVGIASTPPVPGPTGLG